MPEHSAEKTEGPAPASAPPGSRGGGNLLIVEPEQLLRWSLVTYLSKWFRVFPADSTAAADRILDHHPIDAVVLSDDLGQHGADEIEAHTLRCNPRTRVVRAVMLLRGDKSQPGEANRIEKPFELARLAALLGVGDAVPPSVGEISGCSTRTA